MKLETSTESGLSWKTIRRYAKSKLLERGINGSPVYMHQVKCLNLTNELACYLKTRGSNGQFLLDLVEKKIDTDFGRFLNQYVKKNSCNHNCNGGKGNLIALDVATEECFIKDDEDEGNL